MPRHSSQPGATIRRLRIARGMSQRELAGERYTPQYISSLEGGHTRPSERALTFIADRLGVSPGSLLDGTPRPVAIDAERLMAAERALEEAAAALRQLRASLTSDSSPPRRRRVLAAESPPPARRSRSAARTGQDRQPPLQTVITDVLRRAGKWLSAGDIAQRVTAAGWTPPRSGHELRPNQIYARTTHRHYRDLFARRDGLIGLAEWER